MAPALHPVVLSHCFLILVLAQGGGHSRLAFEGPAGVTNHQAKQDRRRPSSTSRQSCAKFEGQRKSVFLRGHVWVGRVENWTCLGEAHGYYYWRVGKAVA